MRTDGSFGRIKAVLKLALSAAASAASASPFGVDGASAPPSSESDEPDDDSMSDEEGASAGANVARGTVSIYCCPSDG